MKTLIFEFEEPLAVKTVYALGVNDLDYIEIINMFELGVSAYKGFKCPEDRIRDAKQFFDSHKIKFKKVDETETKETKYIYVKLQEPLDCVLLKLMPPMSLRSAEYCQIEKKAFLEAFKCTSAEFEPIGKAFDEIGVRYNVY